MPPLSPIVQRRRASGAGVDARIRRQATVRGLPRSTISGSAAVLDRRTETTARIVRFLTSDDSASTSGGHVPV
jgi:hypothetical protein